MLRALVALIRLARLAVFTVNPSQLMPGDN